MKSIIDNWEKYDTKQLLKVTALYRYLPNAVVVGSLNKLFSSFPNGDLGYLKHLEIITEIMEKKEKVQLEHLSNLLIIDGRILYDLFKHHFEDFEIVMRFINSYNVFGGARLLGGLMFNHISNVGKPDRKGFQNDYDLLKQSFSIYYTCVNLRSKIKVKYIDDMPENIRYILENFQPTLGEVLEGFFSLSNFSNCNEYFGKLVAESV